MRFMSVAETIKDKLERKIKLIQSVSEKDKILEIVPYLEAVIKNPLLLPILSKLENERKQDVALFENLEKDVKKELSEALKEIRDGIETIKSPSPHVQEIIDDIERAKAGKLISSLGEIGYINSELAELGRKLIELGEGKIVEKYAIRSERGGEIIEWRFSDTYKKYKNEEQTVSDKKRIRPWAAWERLKIIPFALEEYKVEWEKLKKDYRVFFNTSFLIGEFRRAIDSKDPHTEGMLFNSAERLSDLMRLHYFILDGLDKAVVCSWLLERFKNRFEWFEEDEKKTKIPKRWEATLKKQLMLFLFDQGVFPIPEAIFGSARPDIFGVKAEEVMPIEVKVYQSSQDLKKINIGFNQIYRYVHTLDEHYGYFVIFNASNESIDIPSSIVLSKHVIFLHVIDLRGAPSKSSMKRRAISEEMLLGSNLKR